MLVMRRRSFLVSMIRTSPVRPITTCMFSPSLFCVVTERNPSNWITPSNLAVSVDSTDAEPATPPTWKVRSVSCVPGSPMDCAAMIPTASPLCAR
nr:uncharacterized protein [uncultured bacterium]